MATESKETSYLDVLSLPVPTSRPSVSELWGEINCRHRQVLTVESADEGILQRQLKKKQNSLNN